LFVVQTFFGFRKVLRIEQERERERETALDRRSRFRCRVRFVGHRTLRDAQTENAEDLYHYMRAHYIQVYQGICIGIPFIE